MDPIISQTIAENPIGNGLEPFQEKFRSTCVKLGIPASVEAVQQVVKHGSEGLLGDLILNILSLPATRLLPYLGSGSGRLSTKLHMLAIKIEEGRQDLQTIVPLLTKAVEKAPDVEIWDEVYKLVTGVFITALPQTPRRSSQPSHVGQTPFTHSTAGIVNSPELRQDFDKELRQELDTSLYIDVPGFTEAFFGGVSDLKSVAETVFQKCQTGKNQLFNKESGWQGWPSVANEPEVLEWFKTIFEEFLKLAEATDNFPQPWMGLSTEPNKIVPGSLIKRKLDIGFVKETLGSVIYDWSAIVVPGELKCNPDDDRHQTTGFDLARYAREILTAQTRRFVLGFTLCGPLMRLWEFDRLGGIASSAFDINKDGQKFVSAVLGYFLMTDEQLGYDPTITSEGASNYITITKGGKGERLVIDKVITQRRCVVGRTTRCWKAHREGDESKQPLVVKDSWQYPERDEEGEYLLKATKSRVVNVTRYYHHETVSVDGKDDSVVDNVRKGLDFLRAENSCKVMKVIQKEEDKKNKDDLYSNMARMKIGSISRSSRARMTTGSMSRSSMAQKKFRSTSQSKNSKTSSSPSSMLAVPTTPQEDEVEPIRDRVHWRVIMQDFGEPFYQASSRVAMLAALDGAISGHQSLRQKASLLHRDISMNNVLVNEEANSTWPGFLIDLDLAIEEKRLKASGAPDRTGTKAFMSIGALDGDTHSFMHDLESFFWVLFWICIHYTGPKGATRVTEYDDWNYHNIELLAAVKLHTINRDSGFSSILNNYFTPYFEPLIPWMKELRRIVFPTNVGREFEDEGLYDRMRKTLQDAMKDPKVLAE